MPGQGCKSCGQVFWGDGPYFDGLPKPQWAVNPGATRWGLMGMVDPPPQLWGGVSRDSMGLLGIPPFAEGSNLTLLGYSIQG